jgi:general secretion pathway protein J
VRSGGFTLVELVIAMTLMALIGVAVSGVLVIGARAASSAERKTEQARRYRVATELIVRQLRSAAAVRVPEEDDEGLDKGEDLPFFVGERDRLSFVTAAPQMPESSGLAVVELWMEDDQLLMSETPYFVVKAADRFSPKYESLTFAAPLLYDVKSVAFEYQRSDLDRGNWSDSWDTSEEEGNLPASVRIEVEPSVDGGPSWYHEVPVFVATFNEIMGEDHFVEPGS